MQTSGSGTKNPPWARSSVNTSVTGMNPQIMDPNAMMTQQGMMQFQQSQVYNQGMMQAQGGITMPMAGQMPMNQMTQGQLYPGNVVAYPTPRALNPALYANSNQAQPSTEQRVFTGTVTKTHNDFGFVDQDVFYQTSVCAKGIIPKVNDRVLVEATYNANMPFKWNATRVQVLPKTAQNQKPNMPKNSYNAVPPPKKNIHPRHDDRPPRRDERKRSRTRSRSRSRDIRDNRNRRDSPPRKRPVVHPPSPVKYVVRMPRIPLDVQKLDVPSLSQRYTNLYIPSDFFNAHVRWGDTFPPQAPFSLNNPCAYHIMSKEAENPLTNDAVLEPPDSDYRFSAKVMLISMPILETLYEKCGLTKSVDKDKRSSSKTPLHPTRLIKFLVGQKGKGGESFAIGGPWSPSLDGAHPDSDPTVLVKTAIRTCKALTGVDLTSCTQWYRMVEFYYWREGSGGKSRLETVVLFLPDVWSAQPSRIDWTTIQEQYKAACEAAIKKLSGEGDDESKTPVNADTEKSAEKSADKSQIETPDPNDSTITIDENEEDEAKPEPTHYSNIDLRTIKVDQLRLELRARNASCKGVRAQLLSRLSKLIKAEEEKENKEDDVMDLEDDDLEQSKEIKVDKTDTEKREDKDKKGENEQNDKKDKENDDKIEKKEEKKEKTEKETEEENKKLEKDKQTLKLNYQLPNTPHIIVHPLTSAKNGKFTCTVATLSLMLDYRVSDNKEHSFELFVFAELFNEMLMRDFGFYIYKTLYTLPEKTDEKEKDKSAEKADKKEGEKKEEKKDDKDKQDDKEKKDEKDKRDDKDKKDDRRDSRRRDRRESHSDDERSNSPRRRGRGVDLPPDPYLLLSLVYFDTSRGACINKKDLQTLFMSLGLQLSRSQIRSILEKVCVKDSFNYKTLMQTIRDLSLGVTGMMQDLPLDTAVPTSDLPTQIAELEATIASGNRDLLPVFNKTKREDGEAAGDTKDVSKTGMVVFKGRVIDIGALIASESRGAAVRARMEHALEAARTALRAARAAAASTQQAERSAQSQLSDATAHLVAARARITSLTASSKIFHSALKSIQSKVEAVVNIRFEDEDVVEVNGPTATLKNEKDVKKPKVEEVKPEEVKTDEDKHEEKGTTADKKDEPVTTTETTKDKECDIIKTENMEIDDKE